MESNYKHIILKLEKFIRRFYLNELIKGVLLFLAAGLLYFLFTLIIEHTLWLKPLARTILFWIFIVVECALLVKFIVFPLSQLFKIRKGISYEYASELIGKHFSNVNDKLTNVLQLNQSNQHSDLLIASIEQKSAELKPIPFQNAIDFKSNKKYIPLALLPFIIFLLSFVTGNSSWFTDSYTRVVNHNVAFEPPAPFQFYILNDSLSTVQHEDFNLLVRVDGEKLPTNPQIIFNNQSYFLTQKSPSEYSFNFNQVKEHINFYLSSNDVKSKEYHLDVIDAPELVSYDMYLAYPSYTKRSSEKLTGTGNAIIPEGTNVSWIIKTKSMNDHVMMYAKDSILFLNDKSNIHQLEKRVYNNFNYTVSLSNNNLKNYEQLNYNLKVIKDQSPKIFVESALDSLDNQTLYFKGEATDDYAISKIQLVYNPKDNPKNINKINLDINKTNFENFIYSFPNQLSVEDGKPYQLYFEAFDNDAIHHFKSVKSQTFTYRKSTKEELETKQLNQQKEQINQLNSTKSAFEKQEQRLQELSKTQKEKKELNFNDKKRFQDFLKRQEQQEEMMKKFNKQLKDNLEDFEKDKKDPLKEDLKQRLKENEEQLKKDEKLLEELKKMQEKINKEEFTQKLEELANKNKSKKRSMEQLLELTKRFYVAKKAEKLANKLEELAKQQEDLTKKDKDNSSKAQEEINKAFDKINNEIKELQNDNKNLRKPLIYADDQVLEEETKRALKQSKELLEQKEENDDKSSQGTDNQENKNNELDNKAKKKQKKAASKMKSLKNKLANMIPSSGGGGSVGEMLEEDIEMLRQILDNLLKFSFDQEDLMNQLRNTEIDNNKYGNYTIRQNVLESHFEHIDDSLFALSLRQPKLSENVNSLITQVYYNIDKAKDQLSENNIYKGTSSQQYVITNTNELADILSNLMDNLQNQMIQLGQGGEGDMQLPDIIMKQEALTEEMKKKMQQGKQQSSESKDGKESGSKGKEENQSGSEGKKGQQGQQGQQGEQEGNQGQQGQQGQKGQKGQQGQQGNQGQNGQMGQSGQNGNQGQNGKNGNNNNSKSNGEEGAKGNNGTNGTNGQGVNNKEANKEPKYGDPISDEESRQLYQIYKQQQQLRQQLEDKLYKNEIPNSANELIRQMEDVEDNLINNGFTNETLQKMMNVQHQLLKLKNATFMQEKDNQRTSETNNKNFNGNTNNLSQQIKKYFNTTETLNRAILPLKQQYQHKSKLYFKTIND